MWGEATCVRSGAGRRGRGRAWRAGRRCEKAGQRDARCGDARVGRSEGRWVGRRGAGRARVQRCEGAGRGDSGGGS